MKSWIPFSGLSLLVLGVMGYFAAGMAHVATAPTPVTNAVTIHYKIVGAETGALGSDGKHHDTFTALEATTVPVGSRVTIVVSNYDNAMHGMAFPDLQLARMIKPGQDGRPSETVFSFVASRTGKLRWYCPVPCDGDNQAWAMRADASGGGLGQDGFMAGYINVA